MNTIIHPTQSNKMYYANFKDNTFVLTEVSPDAFLKLSLRTQLILSCLVNQGEKGDTFAVIAAPDLDDACAQAMQLL